MSKTRIQCWILGLSVVAFAGTFCGAAEGATPDPIAERSDRMDGYFYKPRSPQTFRALSGLGDPQIMDNYDDPYSRWWKVKPAEKAVLKQLFPNLDVSQEYFYPEFGSCRAESPIAILKDRVEKLGPNHPYVRQWTLVQRAVLSACDHSGQQVAALPAPLTTADLAIARLQNHDRAYQQASLAFYRGDLAGAVTTFQAIAADKSSPLRPRAAYMAVAIRAGSKPELWPRDDKPLVAPEQSVKEARALLADRSLASIHVIAAQLIGWIGARDESEFARRAQVHEALSALEAPLSKIEKSETARRRYQAALTDIGFLHSDLPDPNWWLNGAIPRDYTASRAMAKAAQKDRMAAWMLFPANPYLRQPWASAETMRDLPSDVRAYLAARVSDYRSDQTAGLTESANEAWVHEALSYDPRDSEYIADASMAASFVDDEIARVKKSDDDRALAALPFDFYNLVRQLLMYSHDPDRAERFAEAEKRLKDFPFKSTVAYRSAVNDSLQYLITEGYLAMARKLRDDLNLDAPASAPVSRLVSDQLLIVLAEDENHLVRALTMGNYTPDEYLNGISVDELWKLAAPKELPRGQRALYARAAWTRLYALGRVIDADRDRLMRDLNPELVKNWRSQPDRDVGPDDHTVLADVLASPGLNMVMEDFARMPGKSSSDEPGLAGMDRENHNDNNWWCAWELDRHTRDLDNALHASFGALDRSAGYYGSLTVRQRLAPAIRESFVFQSIDRSELNALSQVGCAPKLLTERVIAWVKNPGWLDSADAEANALANAIVVARWSCNRQGSHAAYSREAFKLLHAMFPNSDAAKRTKYWYACPGVEGGCPVANPLTTPSRH
jgi:hypothetical protein